MRNISLKGKLAILVGILALTVAGVAAVGGIQLARVNATVQELVDVSGKAALLAYEIRVGLLASVRGEKNAVLSHDDQRSAQHAEFANEANVRVKARISELSELLGRVVDEQERSAFDDFRRTWEAFLANQQDVLRLAAQNTNYKAKTLIDDEVVESMDRLQLFLVRVADRLRQEGPQVTDARALSHWQSATEAVHSALLSTAQLPELLYQHVHSSSDLRMQQLDRALAAEMLSLDASLDVLKGSLSEIERGELGQFLSQWSALRKVVERIQEYSHQNTNLASENLTLTKTVELASNCEAALEVLIKSMRARMEQDRANTAHSYYRALILTGGAGALGIAAALVLAGLLARSITIPLSRCVTLANSIAHGDLTQRLALQQRDEVGQLTGALDSASENFSRIVHDICCVSNRIGVSARELTTVSHQMLSQSEEMSIQAGNVAGGTEQMTTNINTMAAAAEQMSMNLLSISSASEESSVNVARISTAAETTARNVATVADSIQEASRSFEAIAAEARDGARITQEAATLAGSATRTMSVLDRSAGEISKVTEMIKLIAMQTNLLALNATIEATSAGEAGKGFAVVASEIKELASQSGKAAEGIAGMVEGIQSSTREAVAVIQQVAETISATNTASERIRQAIDVVAHNAQQSAANLLAANQSVEHIASSIAEVAKGANDASRNAGEASRAASDVSRNASEAARSVRDISSNIQGVSQATKDNTLSAHQVNKSADDLQKIAGYLQQAIRRFKLGDIAEDVSPAESET